MKQAEVKVVVQKMVKAGESVSTIENFIKEAAKRNSLGKKKNSTTSATVESPLAQRISDLPSENTSSELPKNGILPSITVSFQDMQEFGTTDPSEIKRLKKEKLEKEKIKREKFNKRIKVEDEVEDGVITKEEGEIKINNLNSIYDNANNDEDVYNNTKIVNIKNSDESDVVKEQQLSSLIADNEVIRLDVKEFTFTTADMDKDGVIDEQERKIFNYRQTYEEEAKTDWEKLIEVSEDPEDLSNLVFDYDPSDSLISPTGKKGEFVYKTKSATIKEVKDEKNQAELEKILIGYYVQKYATENNMKFEDAFKVYDPKEEGLINFNNLTNGSIPTEDVGKIKKYWVDNTTDRNTRETVQAELESFYQENTSYFEGSGRYYKGRSEEQMDDREESRENLAGVREETKAVTTKIDLLNGVFDKNKKTYDLLLKEIESTPTGTVIVDGEIYKDENGEELC